jgi:hypothetical protein
MIVYKYRAPNERAWSVLRDLKLHFSTLDKLNDPLDGQFSIDRARIEAIARARRRGQAGRNLVFILGALEALKLSLKAGGEVEYTQFFDGMRQQASVLSFSKSCVDALLWAHYGGEHKGFALGFDANRLPAMIRGDVTYVKEPLAIPVFEKFGQTMYAEIEPEVDAYEKVHGDKIIEIFDSGSDTAINDFFDQFPVPKPRAKSLDDCGKGLFLTVLYSKSVNWAYEQEFRMTRLTPGDLEFKPRALREVVVGLKTSDRDIDKVRSILAAGRLAHVKLRRVCRSEHSFDFSVRPLEEPD